MIDTDLIIVGQGLAGSVLALKCIEQGYSVVVIDKGELSNCSKIAAGIWNPVVFKRLTKSWMADDLLPELLQFYRRAEEILNTSLITKREIIKLFTEQQEVDLWKKKAGGELEGYLDKHIYHDNLKGIKSSAYGYSKVLKAGNLDVKKFLALTKEFLIGKKSFFEDKFEYIHLKTGERLCYKNITAKRIVFAEGYLIKNNPYFNYIPFKPAKGEILTISSNDLGIENNIISKNAFLMCFDKVNYKVGATYNWEYLNDDVTKEALDELANKFAKITDAKYAVTDQQAGVRPSVIDRRPVIGKHPVHKNMFVFNGFGTKGVMLTPYFANKLIDSMKSEEPFPEDVDVSRFNKFFVN